MITILAVEIGACDEGHVHGSVSFQDTDTPDYVQTIGQQFETVEQGLQQALELINTMKSAQH